MRNLTVACSIWGAVFGFVPSAFAEEDTASTESAAAPDEAGAPAAGSATEKTDVQASPEVQSQVGVGTEKEETGDEYDPTSPFSKGESQRRKKSYGHGLQFGARAGAVFPYEIQFGFDDSPPCDPDGDGESSATCGFVGSTQLDFALSFAPIDSIEPFAWARIGLGDETETGTKALQLFGAGIRIYTMSESKFKLFFEAAAGVELEGAIEPTNEDTFRYGTDIFAHLGFGPQFDFNRYIGLYAAIGPGVSFTRAITMQLEATAGLQARVP